MFLATVFIIFITLLNIVVYYLRKHRDESYDEGSHSSSSSSSDRLCRRFSLAEIKSATNNFDEALVVGKGGFGKVYRGTINNPETTVAIKRLDLCSKQGAPEFWTEIEMLSKFKHSHLVSLIGYCDDYQEMIIVYEYMSSGSLRDHLHKIGGAHCKPFALSWLQRLKICIGAARGLDYLHTGTSIQQRVIHRDVKSSNILLDENWAAKISDFGLSKIGPANQDCTHVSTHVKGTFGYMDPEYYLTRRVTRKSDVYALGVVLLEVLCGRPALDLKLDDEQHSLARWAKNCIKEGKVDQMIDSSLAWQILPICLKEFAQVANQCLHNQPKKRPTMAEVVVRLEFALSLQERTDFSVLEGQIIVGAYDKQENMDSSTEHELVSPRGGDEHQEELIDGYTRLSGASRAQNLTFIRMVQSLFSRKTSVLPVVDGDTSSESLQFSFATIRLATDNFSVVNLFRRDGDDPLYRGRLQNGKEIVVKRIMFTDPSNQQLENVVFLLAKRRHRNLVKLVGFCMERMGWLLIYEFVPNGSVESFIFDQHNNAYLDWDMRYKIIVGAAQGLLYLHEDTPVPIIHSDVKASNILLDEEMNPKISDYDLAMSLWPERIQSRDTLVLRTMRYMAPECIEGRPFSTKSDVFSFGVLVLEIVSGLRNEDSTCKIIGGNLLRYAWKSWREGTTKNLMDPVLKADSSNVRDIMRCIQIGLLCAQVDVAHRPTMASVVHMLGNSSLTLPQPSEFMNSKDVISDQEMIMLEQWRSLSGTFSFIEDSISDLYPH